MYANNVDGSGKWGKGRKQTICKNIICKIRNIHRNLQYTYFAKTHSNERIDFQKVDYREERERALCCSLIIMSVLKKINPEYSLEELMLKLKLQFFVHLMQRTDSSEKTLMLGKMEDKRSMSGRG